MPNINDIKTKKGFVPTISTDVEEETTEPTISVGGMNITKAKVSDQPQHRPSATIQQGPSKINEISRHPQKPVAADFSSIPSGLRGDMDRNAYNENIKESIESEIFKPGGMFDEYKQRMLKEYERDMETYDAAVESANPDGSGAPISSEDEEETTEEYTDKETTIIQPTAYRSVNLVKETKEEEKMEDNRNITEVTEEVLDDLVDEVPEEEDDIIEDEVELVPEPVKEQHVEIEHAEKITEESIPDAVEEVEIVEEIKPMPIHEVKKEEAKPQQPKRKSAADTVRRITRSYMAIDTPDDDEDDESSVEVPENDEEDRLVLLKNLITEKIQPVSKKFDLNSFTIAKKGTTSNNILATGPAALAKWVLPNTGVVIQMREISGANLELVRTLLEDRGSNPDTRGALKVIYDHIVSPKPESFEKWLKEIAFTDFDNLFMAAYIASFSEANFLPIDCINPKCNKVYLSDNINMLDMVKFKDEESEKKFWDLYNSDAVESNGYYTTDIIPISDNFAVSFREPSIYSVMIERNYFNDSFVSRYEETIGYLPYIDALYWIDQAGHQLVPVEYKDYTNNISRTARSKVQRYDKVLNTLTSDQHAIIGAYINKINERNNWFEFQIPETTCPNCGNVTPANTENQTASGLLFLRSRLSILATI